MNSKEKIENSKLSRTLNQQSREKSPNSVWISMMISLESVGNLLISLPFVGAHQASRDMRGYFSDP